MTMKIVALVAGLLVATTTVAMAQTPVRVRGSITELSGQTLKVKSREGSVVELKLADGYTVTGVVKAALTDIKPGAFVGAAALKQPDGSFRAQEVLIFPESARGTGEGHRPWDLTPDSTMTNATVDAIVEKVDGPILTLKYPNGQASIVVPRDVPIVTFSSGDPALLRPGAAVFIPATHNADGTFTTNRILVGKDGVVPPM
jgi:hypothetical protein